MTKKATMEERQNALEHRLQDLRMEWRNQREEFRRLLEQMERHSRRRRGSSRRSRPHEESGETMEPAIVKKLITVRKSEKVKEKDGNAGECYDGEPVSVIAKSEEAEWNGVGQESPPEPPEPPDPLYDTNDEETSPTELSLESRLWPLEEVKWDEEPSPEDWMEETVMEDSPSETSGGGMTFTEESRLIDLGKITTSCVTILCDREKKDEDEESSEEKRKGDSLPEVPLLGGTAAVEEGWLARDEEEKLLSGSVGAKTSVEWSSMQLDPAVNSLGQAQVKVCRSYLLDMGREVLAVKTEKERKLFGLGLFKKKVDLTFNPLGQAHHFIITSPQYLLIVEGGLKVKEVQQLK